MLKEKILIERINDGSLFEKEDEVAVEYTMKIAFSSGVCVSVTCTPSHLEEMVVARKFLEKDFDTQELQGYMKLAEQANTLEKINLTEIFTIAKDFFDQPGLLFVETGCAHSCALIFQGKAVCCIEDIGRHNALDKVIGYAIKHQIPMKECYVFTSGRISGDYMQKVIDAGFPMVISRAAVTEQAVKLAKKHQVTMLGFIRKNSGNLYHEGAVKIWAED